MHGFESKKNSLPVLLPNEVVTSVKIMSTVTVRCATSRTVPGSIPGGVTGFLIYIFPSYGTMALGSTQFLVKISTRNIPGGKGSRCMRLTTSPPSCAEFHENLGPKPPGTLWATPGLLRDCFTFTVTVTKVNTLINNQHDIII